MSLTVELGDFFASVASEEGVPGVGVNTVGLGGIDCVSFADSLVTLGFLDDSTGLISTTDGEGLLSTVFKNDANLLPDVRLNLAASDDSFFDPADKISFPVDEFCSLSF